MVKNYVKIYRSKMNLSQKELGELVGASRQTINSIEKMNYSPSIFLCLKLSKVLNIKVDDLFFLEY
ncbi:MULTISPECIES: helix-turn-helix transcriptional regulator [Bacillota]|uniref:helix-turn-helix transcriptional regulator n=1 Tax=Bacillota TaxID=1239 RepID=UPI002AD3C2CC|nr:helix-turn-helix transcriptional regulator [Staphylococcus epidermidis]